MSGPVAGAGRGAGFTVRWEGVRFGYGTGPDVLHDVTLEVQAGESVALVGKNGAGKTTLTRMLMGLARPRAGRVIVGDWDVATKRPDQMARRVGYVFQHADQQLFARTIREDVAFGPRRLGLGDGGVDGVLAELGLDAVAGRHPYDVPAPIRKLVALAGVLAMEPGVLVLDEPTAGFDRARRDLVVGALGRRSAAGVTVIVISHDPAFARAIAERDVALRNGRMTTAGDPTASA